MAGIATPRRRKRGAPYIERLRSRVRKLEASTADRKRSLRAAGRKIEHLERDVEGARLYALLCARYLDEFAKLLAVSRAHFRIDGPRA